MTWATVGLVAWWLVRVVVRVSVLVVLVTFALALWSLRGAGMYAGGWSPRLR